MAIPRSASVAEAVIARDQVRAGVAGHPAVASVEVGRAPIVGPDDPVVYVGVIEGRAPPRLPGTIRAGSGDVAVVIHDVPAPGSAPGGAPGISPMLTGAGFVIGAGILVTLGGARAVSRAVTERRSRRRRRRWGRGAR